MEAQAQQGELLAVVDRIFAESVSEFTAPSNGTVIKFPRAKLKQLGAATRLFQSIAERVPEERIAELLDLVIAEQKQLLAEGKSVHDMNLNASNIITKALGNRSLLFEVFAACTEELSKVVAVFTNISVDEYEELDLEEQLIVAAGIFAVNYNFFTQSLPPILRAIFAGWKKRISARNGKPNQNSATARS